MKKTSNRAVIVDFLRTGITKSFRGKLKNSRPDQLAVTCIDELLKRNPEVDIKNIEDCIVGCAFPEGAQGMNMGRNIAVLSELSSDVPGMTVNRYCASGLQSIAIAASQIYSFGNQAVIAGGVESISLTLQTVNTENLFNRNHIKKSTDIYFAMNIENPEVAFIKNVFTSMGATAEEVARQYGVSRKSQDEYAFLSQSRTQSAQNLELFSDEIIPVDLDAINNSKHTPPSVRVLNRDECNRPKTTLDLLSTLKPSFYEHGTVTAGNSSQITDGCAMALLASEEYVEQRSLHKLGYFHGFASTGCEPKYMGTGPVRAVNTLLSRHRLSINDIDLWEMNEAFASTVVYCTRELGISMDKLNVNGGAISIGHPFGMTGTRMTGHILRELKRRGGRFGVVTICVGGGMGVAALVEAAYN